MSGRIWGKREELNRRRKVDFSEKRRREVCESVTRKSDAHHIKKKKVELFFVTVFKINIFLFIFLSAVPLHPWYECALPFRV